ncbi:unnamed protein product [Brassica oleracea]|uniref:(rape) hypothetical protein n=1 Tax=Brassica napus TaxID=3708 RepID=A0A816N317_BRANA|nr:unnamed protein product [Brassica napus]
MRSRNPIIQLLKQCLPPADPISNSVSDDKFVWKTRQHLYFDCQYSSAVWSYFMVKVNLQPPQSFDAILSWLDRPIKHLNTPYGRSATPGYTLPSPVLQKQLFQTLKTQ